MEQAFQYASDPQNGHINGDILSRVIERGDDKLWKSMLKSTDEHFREILRDPSARKGAGQFIGELTKLQEMFMDLAIRAIDAAEHHFPVRSLEDAVRDVRPWIEHELSPIL